MYFLNHSTTFQDNFPMFLFLRLIFWTLGSLFYILFVFVFYGKHVALSLIMFTLNLLVDYQWILLIKLCV